MAEETRLTLVILAVEDLRRAVAFYRAAFRWPQTVDEAVYAEFALPGAVRLGLYTHAGFERNTGQAPLKAALGEITGTEIYLFVDDLSASIARVEAAGGRTLSPRALRDWGDEAAYFADPDGNVVVLAQPHTPHASPSEP
ncbi:MAG TPA: VOC family protein [Ktedonobacterales bacterium]|jgi:predicted enzyme related to lactoylglutathione lyase